MIVSSSVVFSVNWAEPRRFAEIKRIEECPILVGKTSLDLQTLYPDLSSCGDAKNAERERMSIIYCIL